MSGAGRKSFWTRMADAMSRARARLCNHSDVLVCSSDGHWICALCGTRGQFMSASKPRAMEAKS